MQRELLLCLTKRQASPGHDSPLNLFICGQWLTPAIPLRIQVGVCGKAIGVQGQAMRLSDWDTTRINLSGKSRMNTEIGIKGGRVELRVNSSLAPIPHNLSPASLARGWVYVITNKAMPGLVKVGYTLKDPIIRAKELDGTGMPHPYLVDYEVFVKGPRDIEQQTHARLSHAHEEKEWFRCDVSVAISEIEAAVGPMQFSELDVVIRGPSQLVRQRTMTKGCRHIELVRNTFRLALLALM